MQETSPYKLIYDDLSHYDGYIHIYTKHNDKMRPVAFCLRSDVCERIEQLKIHKNCDYYITANATIANKRQKNYLLSYNNIVVDVDCHNAEVPQDLKDLAVDTLLDKLQGLDIPQPSIIHLTGRGVQLWWHIEQISSKLFFLYDKACDLLCSVIDYVIEENPTFCGCLSVDRAASLNAVGLFRLFGTYNTKTNTKTEYTITPNNYTIHEIIEGLQVCEDIPTQTPQEQQKRPVIHCIDCNYINLQRGRMNVLEQLAIEQTREGLRELILFLYYNAAFQVYEVEVAENLTRQLNNSLFEPLPEKVLKCIFCCIDKKYYKYKNKTFCEVLGISSDYYNKYSNKKEQERKAAQMDKQKRREMAETLKQSGKYTNAEIAEITGFCMRTIEGIKKTNGESLKPWEALGISRRTYYRKKSQGKI